ncbi:MAG: xanthine permease [Oscillospiraceae bacterium]|jgi:uracil permease|nr:xanthine permease [Oscillospiraceae bacterium]
MQHNSRTPAEIGYLPDETPSIGKLLVFAFQQVLVMFPATVTVALLTGFHVSTTIFASGLATLCFLLITRGKIPLYYGSSFSYIAAIVGITGASQFGVTVADNLISQAQFGIICSGLVSIVAGIIVSFFGIESIEKVLPPTITGSIALVIGISLAGTAMTSVAGYSSSQIGVVADAVYTRGALDAASSNMWIAALVTLLATIVFSVYLKGVWSQLPILLGILTGYAVSIPLGLIDFTGLFSGSLIAVPHFTLPKVSGAAALAIMPIAIATIPESTAHLFQLDIYVNDLARRKGKGKYNIADKLGLNLIGDGVGDIVSSLFGGPAGTNYGENISTMAITRNFSCAMLAVAAVIAMILSFFTPLSNLINTVPSAVINGACIFLFGVIAAQGIAIMINKKVDMFDARNLAVISTILIIGLGGSFGFPGGMIPIFGGKMPAIASAAIFGIALNLLLSARKKGVPAE